MSGRFASFSSDWLKQTDLNGDTIESWLNHPEAGSSSVSCKVCNKKLEYVSEGVGALKKHANGIKHKAKMVALKKTPALLTVMPMQPAKPFERVLSQSDITMAELKWSLHVIEQNHSFLSQNHVVTVFQNIFPKDLIPKKMALKKSKLAYLVTDAIYPEVILQLREEITAANKFIAIQIDEANKGGKQCLAVVVRYMPAGMFESHAWLYLIWMHQMQQQ